MIPVREPPPPPPGGRAPLAANSAALEDSRVVRSYARQSQTVPRDPQVPWSALLRVLGPQRDWLLGGARGRGGGAECRATGLQRTPAQEPASAVERWLLGRARRAHMRVALADRSLTPRASHFPLLACSGEG